MSAPTAVLAEDEEVLRGELRARLAALWPELAIVAEASDGVEATRAFAEHSPDILVLDIRMPGMTGLEVARLASGKCHVVFVTAYDKYAVAAFEQGAVDYVLKPFSTARLAETVSRLKDRMRERPANLDRILTLLADSTRGGKQFLRWVTALQGNTTSLITVENVCYFRADDKYTTVVTPDREALIRRPIRELAEAVDPDVFWRIHRSTLVNINYTAGIVRDFRGHLSVKLKSRSETLPVSESYVHLFRGM
ncbi:MAG TPA: LytTR family DNA-binding domain-containing protein [Casimicrobiaceae bacterium]|nr:LytTR family DNA-binding domain-containing protein [Casimicrobiaceae bacterium]